MQKKAKQLKLRQKITKKKINKITQQESDKSYHYIPEQKKIILIVNQLNTSGNQ